jgi:ADP-heptose:LPS heptosyltransferase
MSKRFRTRLQIAGLALRQLLAGGARRMPAAPRRILVIAPLFAGDALLLTPLLAKLRRQHPSCELYLIAGRTVQALYQGRPYGVQAGVFDPRDPATLRALRRWPAAELAIVAGESRYSWLALALGARWIVGFGGERPRLQNRALDERIPLPQEPMAWGDMAARLASGPAAPPFESGDWPDPAFASFEFPPSPYCLLHVEASSPLKQWQDAKWLALAEWLSTRGVTVVWSAGRGGRELIRRIDPEGQFASMGWQLDLAQLWQLVKRAALLVSVDTSVGHIGKLTATPTLVLFGPGSASLYGAGDFWRRSPWRAATEPDFPCRDRRILFKRDIPWIRRCDRQPGECAAPRCMHAIGIDAVRVQIDQLLSMREPA